MRKEDAYIIEHPRYETLECYVEGCTGYMTGEVSHLVAMFTEEYGERKLVATKRVFGCEDAEEAAYYAASLV